MVLISQKQKKEKEKNSYLFTIKIPEISNERIKKRNFIRVRMYHAQFILNFYDTYVNIKKEG